MDRQQTVRTMLGQIASGTVDPCLFTADGSWWSNAGAVFPIAEFNILLRSLHDVTRSGIEVTPERFVEQGDVVVAQATSQADLDNGRSYANRYAFIVSFEGDKVREVREYSDTAHIYATFDITL